MIRKVTLTGAAGDRSEAPKPPALPAEIQAFSTSISELLARGNADEALEQVGMATNLLSDAQGAVKDGRALAPFHSAASRTQLGPFVDRMKDEGARDPQGVERTLRRSLAFLWVQYGEVMGRLFRPKERREAITMAVLQDGTLSQALWAEATEQARESGDVALIRRLLTDAAANAHDSDITQPAFLEMKREILETGPAWAKLRADRGFVNFVRALPWS